ncbi:hypothetical protein ACJRO7_026906, partial [Eucalyptus globulus]
MFTSTMATNLVELTKLRISKCEMLTEVISDEGGKEGHVVAFNQLKYMELSGLTRLRCFSSSRYTLMFPLLKDIIVSGCPKMNFFYEGPMEAPKLERVQVGSNNRYGEKKCQYFWKGNLNTTIQNMFEEMVTFAGTMFMWLFEFSELIGKWHGELNPVTSSWQLETLVVDKCPSFINAIPSNLMVVLERMRSLRVHDCELLEEIFDFEGLEAVDCIRVLPRLKDLYLVNLPKLRQLWSRDLQGTMCFNSLWFLSLYKCSNLRHAFVPSMTQRLPNLRHMEIKECDQMEGVIVDEDGQGSMMEEITFPYLTWIHLEYLPNLSSFLSWKNHMLECPILSMLSIAHCPKMRSLTWQSSVEIDNGTPSLFTPQVQCPKLEQMFLSHMDNLSKIWSDGRQGTLTFDNLRKVQVQNCRSLKNVFPRWVATSLTQLKELQVESCGIEEIVASGNEIPHSNPKALFPELTSLVLHDMPQLKNFYTNLSTLNWLFLKELRVTHCDKANMLSFVASMSNWAQKDDQQGLSDQDAHSLFERIAFSRLETLKIYGLDNFEFLFFPSMIKSLAQLRYLTINNCEKMKAIVMEEERLGLETSETLEFPMLTNLNLGSLESLICFSRGKRSRETRSQDRVKSCFTALFNQEVAFPNLENLDIKGMDNIEMIWHDPIHADSFSKLKLILVSECKRLVNIVPSFILGRLLSLETLTANKCDSLEVVFKLQPPNPLDGNSVACSPLKELKLDDLSMLNCIWDKELYRHIKFQCLRSVTLRRCARLTSLFSTSIATDLIQLEELVINQCGIVELIEKEGLSELSINVKAIEGPSHELKVASSFPSYFQHMKTLDVSLCHGLSNMFTSTIAANLVGLIKLRISKCEILTEVISDEGGKEGHVVTFDQLKYMELDGLTRLRCFSSNGYTLMFPLLEDIIVKRCPHMKFFHKGQIEVPKLKGVKVGLNEFWKGNLNTTIQNMVEEMAMFTGTKCMWLFEFPELIGKWHGKLNPITSSWQLQSLVVDKCPSFISAIPSSLMLVLKRMASLQVCNCESLEEIFDLEGLEAVDCTQVLPLLEYLYLVNLPKLRQLWNRDLQGTMCFNYLECLSLYKCSILRHAFVPSMARCLPNIWHIEIKECDQMKGVIVDEEGQGSAGEEITFPYLMEITLECLPNLTSFLSWKNHMLECPILSKLSIGHCPKMRSLTWESSMEINNGTPSLFTPQVQFPQLRGMDLSHMDNLSKIWTDGSQETLTFDCLKEVEVRNCKSLENLFPYWVATSLTQLEKLQVESCEIEEIVASGNETPRSNTTQDLFPKLTSLVLHDMPRLKSFCPNLPTLNWPFLEELRVTHCDKLNMLSFTASMNSWAQRDDQQDLSNQEAHSSFERDFPNFERLLLVDNNIQMIQGGNLPDDIFSKLEALTVACFHDEKTVFPLRFLLERFQNLQSLEVFCSSFEDIFPDEGLVDKGKHPVLENLREIKLNKLHNLKRVWREDSLVLTILQ